ncbi:MAG TPA: pitrilysin family protein, partial [Acidimicrobiales bacterium]|nr:pitrilysin family protein [Acidimicrobiales bacterium]
MVTETMPAASSVAAGFWVGTGSRDEEPVRAGASHFLEHLLFKGTPRRTAADIGEAIDAVGGDMNAFTTKEYTAYYTRLPAAALPLGLEVLGDVLTAPALRDTDVESERQVILEELLMDEDSPEDRAHTLLFESLFPGHPLGRETAGTRE